MSTQILLQELEGGSIPTSPHQLYVKEISGNLVVRLNKQWHSRLPYFPLNHFHLLKPNINYGFCYKNEVFAIAIWTRPIARELNDKQWLELRRYAIRPEASRHTASWGPSRMTILIKKKYPDITKLISYQDTSVHKGIIYKASGWEIGFIKVRTDGDKCWRSRNKHETQTKSTKIRWEKNLKKDK